MTPFLTGFLQVLLVSANTVFLSNRFTPGVAVAGYLISLVWTYNVRAALGDWKQRQAYCIGAMTGGITGMYLSNYLISIFH